MLDSGSTLSNRILDLSSALSNTILDLSSTLSDTILDWITESSIKQTINGWTAEELRPMDSGLCSLHSSGHWSVAVRTGRRSGSVQSCRHAYL